MALEEGSHEANDLWAEPQRQQRKREEAHTAGKKNRQKKMPEVHFGNSGSQHENLEWHRWRKHSGKHQSPEFVFLKRAVNFFEALRGNALAQDGFATDVSDDVQRNAAQRGPHRSEQHVNEKSRPMLIDIGCHDGIDRHAEQRAVGERDDKDAPYPEHREQAPYPCRVAPQELCDRLQRKTVYVKKNQRVSLFANAAYPAYTGPMCRSAMITGFGAEVMMGKLILTFLVLFSASLSAQQYDLVIAHGRVIDPETGLDAVRNVAIQEGKIVRISSDPLSANRTIDAAGLVVAPGFIDLHQHGQDLESQRVKAFDGVTTALEMEIGAPDVAEFLKMKQGHSLINYGTTASHVAARALVFGAPLKPESLDFKVGIPEILPKSGPATNEPANDNQIKQIQERLLHEFRAGALGLGMGIQYTPGATRMEVIAMFRLAAEHKLPVYTHLRSFGQTEPGSAIESLGEVIGAAAISGAALHVVHINSTCLMTSLECLSLIEGARAHGLDVTTEAYPYIAGMTILNSAQFNPGWREKLGIDYDKLVLPSTGEHLTKERFEELHNSNTPQSVLVFANTQEMVDKVITNPLTMIASDGAPGHPRNAGTYTRVLAQYVREQKTLTLMEALRKMTLMPAQMLERSTPAARHKGRLQEGADADVVVFDPQKIEDRATFDKPMEASEGVRYLLVGGTVLIDQGKLVSDVYPGRAIVGTQN